MGLLFFARAWLGSGGAPNWNEVAERVPMWETVRSYARRCTPRSPLTSAPTQ
jgi:hypothetical protein